MKLILKKTKDIEHKIIYTDADIDLINQDIKSIS